MNFPDCIERYPLYNIYLSSKNMKAIDENEPNKKEEYAVWCDRERILKGAIDALGWNDRLEQYEQAYDDVVRGIQEDAAKRFYLENWNHYIKE